MKSVLKVRKLFLFYFIVFIFRLVTLNEKQLINVDLEHI